MLYYKPIKYVYYIKYIYTTSINKYYKLITSNILNNINCIHSKLVISDINNDEIPDLIRGNASGGLEVFQGETFNVKTLNNNNHALIKIYPNPNNGSFYIENIAKKSIVEVYSIDGKLIKSQISHDNKLKLSGLTNGIYVLVVTNDINKQTKKLIINNED